MPGPALQIAGAFAFASLVLGGVAVQAQGTRDAVSQRDSERLAELVNDYRAQKGLPRIPISPSLTRVAAAHVNDMANQPNGGLDMLKATDPVSGEPCSPHSWSDQGAWNPVCYTPDNRYAQNMWDKPSEITEGAYFDYGFEIAYWHEVDAKPQAALDWWKKSSMHNGVIVETGQWEGSNFQAMGVAVGGKFAFVWFGRSPDTAEQ